MMFPLITWFIFYFVMFILWSTVVYMVESRCNVPKLVKLGIVLDRSSPISLKWTQRELLQSATHRLQKDTLLLKSTRIELYYAFESGNISSVGQCLGILCEDLLPRGIHGILSSHMHGTLQTQTLTQFAALTNLPVWGTSRSSSLQNKEGYGNYIFLLPPLTEQVYILESIIRTIGVERYTIICGKGKNSINIAKHLFIRTRNSTKEITIMNLTRTSNQTDRAEVLNLLVRIKYQGIRAIVLDCDSIEAKSVLEAANDLGLLSNEYLWLVTERVLDLMEDVVDVKIPHHVLGVRLNASAEEIASNAAASFLQIMDYIALHDCSTNKAIFSSTVSCSNSSQWTPNSHKYLVDAIQKSQPPYRFYKYSIFKRRQYVSTPSQFKPIASWSQSTKIPVTGRERLLEQYRSFGRYSHQNATKRLRIVTIEHGQYTFQVRNIHPKCPGNEDTCLDSERTCSIGVPCTRYISINDSYTSERVCVAGLMIELLKLIQSEPHIMFNYDMYLIKDNKYGGMDPKTGKWNGMIGDLMAGEADMALATLTITESRSAIVDFSWPYGEVGIGILASTESQFKSVINMDFLSPLSLNLWLVILITIFTVFTTLWILDRKSWEWYFKKRTLFIQGYKKRVTFLESMSYTWSTFVHVQAGMGLPRSTSARLVSVFFAFAMIIVSTSYTAELAAHKVKEEITSPITGIFDEKMVNPPANFKYATLKDSSTEAYFRFSEDPRLRRIYENMKDNNVEKVENGVKKLLDGEFQVYIDDQPYLEHLVSSRGNCALRIVGKPFGISGYGIALTRNSPWTRPISLSILKLNEMASLTDLWSKWLKRKCIKQDEFGKIPSGLSIESVNGLFVLVCGGMVFGILCLIIELIVYFLQSRRRCNKELVNETDKGRERHERYVVRSSIILPAKLSQCFLNKGLDASTTDLEAETSEANTEQIRMRVNNAVI